MAKKLFCLVTASGTGCAETCLCEGHATPENKRLAEVNADKDVDVSKGWQDCSENNWMECISC